MRGSAYMDSNMGNLIDRLISISDFSKGKTSHIFDDVKINNVEYIILKNNQPTAVLMSIENYKQIKKLQEFFENLETQILLEQAIEIQNKLDENQMLTMEDVMNKHNISEEELKKAMESVEIE
jgi:prevent-host-death family protein